MLQNVPKKEQNFTGSSTEILTPLREIQDSLLLRQETALGGQDRSLVNKYLQGVRIRALDETDAYYYSLLEAGKLDDKDIDEYSKHIRGFGPRGPQAVIEGKVIDLVQNKKNFLDWLRTSLCPEGNLDPEKARAWIEDLMDKKGTLGNFDSANLTKDDLDFFAKFTRGEAVRKDLQKMRDGILAVLNERIKAGGTIDMKPFQDRFTFYEFLISKKDIK